jgi:hypothetical protein
MSRDNKKIAFIVHSEVAISHFRCIWKWLPEKSYDVVLKRRAMSEATIAQLKALQDIGVALYWADNCPTYPVSVALHYIQGDCESGEILPRKIGRHAARLMYSLGDIEWETARWNRHFHSIFTIGPIDYDLLSKQVEKRTFLYSFGLPKLDDYWLGGNGIVKPDMEWCYFSSIGKHALLESLNAASLLRRPTQAVSSTENKKLFLKRHPDCIVPINDFFFSEVGAGYDSTAVMQNACNVIVDSGGSIFSAILLGKPTIRLVQNDFDKLGDSEPSMLAAKLWATELSINSFLDVFPLSNMVFHEAKLDRKHVLEKFYWNASNAVSQRVAETLVELSRQ